MSPRVRLLVVCGAAALVWHPLPAGAADPPVVDGAVIVTVPDGAPITTAQSSTPFAIELPDAATCPGDSANDAYHVQSYMVPIDVEPESLVFDGLGPAPYDASSFETFRQPLYDIYGEPYDVGFTAQNDSPGRPGLIIDVPVFTFEGWPPGALPVGRYHVGVACTHRAAPVTMWDATIEVVEDRDDEPAQRRWVVLGAEQESGGTGPAPFVVLGAAAALLAVILVARRRRVARSTPRSAP